MNSRFSFAHKTLNPPKSYLQNVQRLESSQQQFLNDKGDTYATSRFTEPPSPFHCQGIAKAVQPISTQVADNHEVTSEYDHLLPEEPFNQPEPDWDEWKTGTIFNSHQSSNTNQENANITSAKNEWANKNDSVDDDGISYSPLPCSQAILTSSVVGERTGNNCNYISERAVSAGKDFYIANVSHDMQPSSQQYSSGTMHSKHVPILDFEVFQEQDSLSNQNNQNSSQKLAASKKPLVKNGEQRAYVRMQNSQLQTQSFPNQSDSPLKNAVSFFY